MIPNKEGWHYIAIKRSPALLKRITSKYNNDYYCLNCLYFFRTKSKLESHKKVCENKDFCNVMSSEDTTVLQFNQYCRSGKAPFIIYADLELLIKIDECKKIWKNHLRQK